ncbi:phospholipase D-like domain-containing protein [Acaryochloris sp. IP29b_bin.137]|uniref:phospholipase D-like domain-containing protein n=1 Tax=Acaryochloris sp. IP29b_bin.137 TaxID=2969217 RepID=UPI00261B95CB|nr:phospholipase D-like domain-containing protein [Acaryochloris sp. IP29b_bin.137]
MQRLQFGLVSVVFLAAIGIGVNRWQRSHPQYQSIPPLPQHSQIQVYMNQNLANSFTDPYRQITRPGDDLESIIVERIQAAQSTVDVAIQELRSPRIAQALRDRRRAGVRVRVVLENTYSRPISSFTPQEVAQMDPRQRDRYQAHIQLIDQDQDGELSPPEINEYDALQVIRNADIPWLDDTADGSAGSGLMHHKFIVIDGQTTLVTTANFTLSGLLGDLDQPDSRGNANSLIVIESQPLAQAFTQEFQALWGDGPGQSTDSKFGVNKPWRPVQPLRVGDAKVHVKFSPSSSSIPWSQSTNGLIGQTLTKADQTIDLALFVFSEQPLVDQLEGKHQQGVTLRVLSDLQFAYQSYSEVLDMLGLALSPSRNGTLTCKVEPRNRPWSQPLQTAGIPQLSQGDVLHHKFGIVDRKTVIVGSHNWSDAANRLNDETLLVIEHPLVAAHYHREFERLYTSSHLGIPPFLQSKAQDHQRQCGDLQLSLPPSSLPGESPAASPASPLVNLNTASQEELEALPGVGPKLAERIMLTRQDRPFTSLADLDQVPGVGPKLLKQLQNRVT